MNWLPQLAAFLTGAAAVFAAYTGILRARQERATAATTADQSDARYWQEQWAKERERGDMWQQRYYDLLPTARGAVQALEAKTGVPPS